MLSPVSTSSASRLRAFTLVELMIVIAVIAILAAIVAPKFNQTTDTAQENSLQRQLQTVRGRLEVYRNQEGQYPPGVVAGTDWDDMTSNQYLVIEPRNPMRQNSSVLKSGNTITVGAPIPGGAAWYFDTDDNRLYASDTSGNLMDF